jgi:tripartite-type tricarboxylate transporter receptor subunit TctC
MDNVRIAVRRRAAWTALLPVAALVATGCGGGGGGGDGGQAQEQQQSCFEGETLTFVVAYGTGGGFDIIARAAAPYLEEELGGTVVVENQPGAGGLTAANTIYASEPDGLTFGFFSGQGLAGAVLGGSSGAQFDLEEFTYIARLSEDDRVLVTGPDNEVQTIEDVQAAQGLQFASAGPGGSDHVDATVLIPVLDMDAEIVTGYEGSSETGLALTSGDADLASGTVSSRMDAMQSGDLAPVLIIAEDGSDEFPDIPALLELELDDEQRALAEAHVLLQSTGFVVLAPPGVPDECTTELQDAFQATAENPEFAATMEEAYYVIEYTSGEELKEVMQQALEAPEEYRALLEGAYENQ